MAGQAVPQFCGTLAVEIVRRFSVRLGRIRSQVQSVAEAVEALVVALTSGQMMRHSVGTVEGQVAGGSRIDEIGKTVDQLVAHLQSHGIAYRIRRRLLGGAGCRYLPRSGRADGSLTGSRHRNGSCRRRYASQGKQGGQHQEGTGNWLTHLVGCRFGSGLPLMIVNRPSVSIGAAVRSNSRLAVHV